jgi:transposase InsO family protein
VGYLCRLFGKTRQGWYEQCKSREDNAFDAAIILHLVKEIRKDMPRAGGGQMMPILKPVMKEHGIKMGRDKLYELLGQHGLLLRYRRRKPYTTDSTHPYRKYPNLIRDLILTGASQLWVSDITYIRLVKGFCYLSIVTDAYSRKIIGHQVHPTLASEGPVKALLMAISTLKRKSKLIHHSDRGVQYCCGEYVKVLEKHNIQISMTENGDPYENAIAERVNGILKGEFGLEKTFDTIEQVIEATAKAVEVYNNLRPHASCDYLTPAVAHEQKGFLRKHWKSLSSQKLQISA